MIRNIFKSNQIYVEDLKLHQKITNSNIPINKIPWNNDFKEYSPKDMKINPNYLGQPFCEKEDDYLRKDFNIYMKYYGKFIFDKLGKPLNPIGRTNKINRGDLAKWGPNTAADPLIYLLKDNYYYVLLIKRADSNSWALPGGMVDAGEKMTITAQRELEEEVGISIDMGNSKKIYTGYVFDPRNTDNAWMVTSVFEKNITNIVKDNIFEIKKHLNNKNDKNGEVLDKGFFKINQELIEHLYASHGRFIKILCNNYKIKIENSKGIEKLDINIF